MTPKPVQSYRHNVRKSSLRYILLALTGYSLRRASPTQQANIWQHSSTSLYCNAFFKFDYKDIKKPSTDFILVHLLLILNTCSIFLFNFAQEFDYWVKVFHEKRKGVYRNLLNICDGNFLQKE